MTVVRCAICREELVESGAWGQYQHPSSTVMTEPGVMVDYSDHAPVADFGDDSDPVATTKPVVLRDGDVDLVARAVFFYRQYLLGGQATAPLTIRLGILHEHLASADELKIT